MSAEFESRGDGTFVISLGDKSTEPIPHDTDIGDVVLIAERSGIPVHELLLAAVGASVPPRHQDVGPVTSLQLATAAELLARAEPSVVNGVASERPGWLRMEEDLLVLRIGILPGEEHKIDRRGRLLA
jgi:hypothetical protein